MKKFTNVKEEEWELIRAMLKRHHNNVDNVKQLSGRSYSTIGRIQASKTYEHYKELVTKERVPRKPGTLRTDINHLTDRVERIEGFLNI